MTVTDFFTLLVEFGTKTAPLNIEIDIDTLPNYLKNIPFLQGKVVQYVYQIANKHPDCFKFLRLRVRPYAKYARNHNRNIYQPSLKDVSKLVKGFKGSGFDLAIAGSKLTERVISMNSKDLIFLFLLLQTPKYGAVSPEDIYQTVEFVNSLEELKILRLENSEF
jgi:hypothetical protein